jgi:hypothetical protein
MLPHFGASTVMTDCSVVSFDENRYKSESNKGLRNA